jgi:putative hydrolase of the HAD superfamily
MSISSPIRHLLIDLDDTLAPEWDFVSGGYRAVAAELAKRTGAKESEVFNWLVYDHHKYGRRGVIDRIALAYGKGMLWALELVEIYRNHDPVINYYPGVQQALEKLASIGCRLGVVTDGRADIQRRKAAVLKLERLVETIVYCDDFNAPKPDPVAFKEAMRRLGGRVEETVVVGDDPYLDIAAAETLGIRAFRIRTGKYGLVAHPKGPVVADLSAFADLPEWFDQNSRGHKTL